MLVGLACGDKGPCKSFGCQKKLEQLICLHHMAVRTGCPEPGMEPGALGPGPPAPERKTVLLQPGGPDMQWPSAGMLVSPCVIHAGRVDSLPRPRPAMCSDTASRGRLVGNLHCRG